MKLTHLCIGLCIGGLLSTPGFAAVNHTYAKAMTLAQLEKQIRLLETEVRQLKKEEKNNASEFKKHESLETTSKKDFGSYVTMGAVTGEPVKVSGPWIVNLLEGSPSVNADLYMLNMRRQTDKNMTLDSPRLIIGGLLEGQLVHESPYYGQQKFDVNLAKAELDFLAQVNDYANAYMQIRYDDSTGDVARRVDNSRLYVNKAFMTFGNFNKSPFYASVGQLYVPFGRYSSNMIADPLTKSLGYIRARALVAGFQSISNSDFKPYGAAYLFKGDSYDSHHADNSSAVNNGGVDLGMKYSHAGVDINVGAGYVDNMAESNQMQTVFDKQNVDENLVHKVPSVELHTSFGYQNYLLYLEYITAIKSFDPNDLSFGKDSTHLSGAKPSAFAVEGIYSFTLLNKPTSIGLGYSTSRQSLGIDIPQDRYLANIQMEIYKQTLLKLEYSHDIYYKNAYASHHGNISFDANKLGKTDNKIVAQVGVYF